MRSVAYPALALGLVLVALALPSLQAQPSHEPIVLVASEEGCPEGRTFCFQVASGDLAAVSPGANVTITLRNDGSAVHNLYVAPLGNLTPGANTPAQAAIANTEDLEPGQSATLSFEVPDQAETLYIWCEISGHEQLGMWLRSDQAPDQAPEAQAPMGMAWLAAALLVAGLMGRLGLADA